ncbi:hypothetical protein O7598_30335 [Micromonospora sp. WMMC241]|uniref:hypothetical protein n=1 Tax=Micromonospora sp. WMMC241 TaxID=3015159 RepID=UPI0022B6AF75|nr:hypothetical protein [Micromonospora sp. WMMC241]MCZ7440722.1 hypothetical protein [Micromonospora sp. WMMC241]
MTTPVDVEDCIVPRTPPRTATLLALLLLTACGQPPELREPPAGTGGPRPTASVAPSGATPTAPATPSAPAVPSAPTAPAPDPAATPCRGAPSGSRIVTLLRGSAGVLPRNVRVTLRTGPLCAEGWHYTVLAVAGHEELQVVTRGRTPTLVTAGTDVCGVEVRATAPAGIRTLACDGIPGA